MVTSAALTSLSVQKLSDAFGNYPDVYNGLISAAQTSPYLAGMINAFVEKGGKFQIGNGSQSSAADTSSDGSTIFIGVSLLPSTTTVNGVTQTSGESPLVLATLLGHELGHALLPGGMGEVDGQSTDPTLAAANGLANEGVGVVSEYIVATQLGLTGQGIIPQTMHSDPNDVLTPQLNQLAQSEGIDVSQLTYGSTATLAFVAPNTAATNAAASYYAQGNPSLAPHLTYQQYYEDAWIINNCSSVPFLSIDWSQVTQSMFVMTNNSNGSCTINASGIPLLATAGGGTAPAIAGTLSAPALNADGSQTTTFSSTTGTTTLQFNKDGGVNGSFTDTSGKITESFAFESNGSILSDTRYQADGTVDFFAYNSDGSGTETITSATGQTTAVVNFDTNGYAQTETLYSFASDMYGNPTDVLTGQTDVMYDSTGASRSAYTPVIPSGQTVLYGVGQTVTYANANNQVTAEASYDTSGNLLSYDQYTYNPDGSHNVEVTDSLGHFVQTYETDDTYTLVDSKSYAPSGYLQEDDQYDPDSLEPSKSISYDSSGNVLRTIVYSYDDEYYNETQTFHDGSGHMYEFIDANNQTHYYDANGNEVSSLDQSCADAATKDFQNPSVQPPDEVSVNQLYQNAVDETNAILAGINATFNQPNTSAGSIRPAMPTIQPSGLPTLPDGSPVDDTNGDGVYTYPVPDPGVTTTPVDNQQTTTPQVSTGGQDGASAPASTGDTGSSDPASSGADNSQTTPPVQASQPSSVVTGLNNVFQMTAAGQVWTDSNVGSLFTVSDSTALLSYTVTLANGQPLPSWLSFDAGKLTLSGTPDTGSVGTVDLKVTATDQNGGTASTTLELQIQTTVSVAGTFQNLTVADDQVGINESNAFSTITASGGSHVLLESGGQSTATIMGTGSNVVTIAGGMDKLALGDGANSINLVGSMATVQAGEGANTIVSTDTSANISLGDGDNTVTGGFTKLVAGNGDNSITSTSGMANITVGAGNNSVSVSGTIATVNLGDGNNIATLSGSMDTVDVGHGEYELDFQGSMGKLQLSTDVASSQLWFEHVGQDLQISVIGTTEVIDLKNWYTSTPDRPSTIVAGDGKSLSSASVEQMVQAMAAFAPPTPGMTSMTSNEQAALNPVLAANWH